MAKRPLTPPNLVFILIDDMGWTDLACTGSRFYETPNLDRLAAEGMRFTDAYAACPVCSPSRASFMTGRYPARLGLTNYIGGTASGRLLEAPYIDHLPLSEVSLARALREGGYATWHVGKWHLGEPPTYPEPHGFDVNVGGGRWGAPHQMGYFAPWGFDTLPEGPDGQYLTDRLTDEAVALIRNRDGRPFFLNLWHYAVHTPLQAPEPLVLKYREKAARLGLDRIEPFEMGEPFPCDHKRHLRVTRRRLHSDPTYAAMLESMDQGVGRVMDALRETGAAENTLVIFTSDNGGLATSEGSPTCNAPLAEGKGWMYEGGTREAFIAWMPGTIPAGSVCSEPITSSDLYPTLLEAAGLPARPEQHCDGVSLMPLLRGGPAPERDALFWHYPHYGNQGGTPGSSVRMGDWKLIEFHEDVRLELYNLRDDIGEARNLASELPERTEAMRQRLAAWRDEVDAAMPLPNPAWEPTPAA
jgi:arylsulfatase A-like enzyme